MNEHSMRTDAIATGGPETTTATITIHALTLDRAHLTPAIYHQIPTRDLITHDGDIDGHPWGRINLHSGCTPGDGHLHVLHTHDGALHTAHVTPPLPDDPELGIARSRAGDRLFDYCLSNHLAGRTNPYLVGQRHIEHGITYEFTPSPAAETALRAHNDADQAQTDLDKAREHHRRRGGYTKAITRAEQDLNAAEDDLAEKLQTLTDQTSGHDPAELHAAFTAQARAEADRRQRVDEAFAQLRDLPQLYILGGDR